MQVDYGYQYRNETNCLKTIYHILERPMGYEIGRLMNPKEIPHLTENQKRKMKDGHLIIGMSSTKEGAIQKIENIIKQILDFEVRALRKGDVKCGTS